MREEDPFDLILRGLEKDTGQPGRRKVGGMLSWLGEFYDNLDIVLQHGNEEQRRKAMELFALLQKGLKKKFEDFCEKENLDMRKVHNFIEHPKFQQSEGFQEFREQLKTIQKGAIKETKSKKLVNKKKTLPSRRKKHTMEKNLKSKL